LNFVVAVFVASVWQNFQDLRAVGKASARTLPSHPEKNALTFTAPLAGLRDAAGFALRRWLWTVAVCVPN